jgi:DNA polymerase V
VIGDSMTPEICEGDLLVVDRMEEPRNRDIVVARIGEDLCVKRLRVFPDQTVYLMSENPGYKPILLTPEMDYEIWGVVLHSVKSFRKSSKRKTSKR